MKKRILWMCGIVLAILFLTNPTMQDFKNYSGYGNNRHAMPKREYNFLIFSIYSEYEESEEFKEGVKQVAKEMKEAGIPVAEANKEDELTIYQPVEKKYLGILKNFIDISAKDQTVAVKDTLYDNAHPFNKN